MIPNEIKVIVLNVAKETDAYCEAMEAQATEEGCEPTIPYQQWRDIELCTRLLSAINAKAEPVGTIEQVERLESGTPKIADFDQMFHAMRRSQDVAIRSALLEFQQHSDRKLAEVKDEIKRELKDELGRLSFDVENLYKIARAHRNAPEFPRPRRDYHAQQLEPHSVSGTSYSRLGRF